MDVLGAHSYDTLVELERREYHEKKFKRCVTIGDIDLVPTFEEYDHFFSLSTLLSTIFIPPVRTRYCKKLADLMGFKRSVVEALTWHGSQVGWSMSFEILYDWFHLSECPVGYCDNFVDLEERWASYWCQAFLVALFDAVLFPSLAGAISFFFLPLLSALPHGTSFIPTLLFETIRFLSLCREAGRGRLDCYIHMLQWWFCSHLSVIARDQPIGFVDRNRIWATVSLDLPFSGDTDGWLRYLCSLIPIDWTWRVKWGITRWQGQTQCVGLLEFRVWRDTGDPVFVFDLSSPVSTDMALPTDILRDYTLEFEIRVKRALSNLRECLREAIRDKDCYTEQADTLIKDIKEMSSLQEHELTALKS
nr:hypothetical protein CFP56_05659 [Quercus suber]